MNELGGSGTGRSEGWQRGRGTGLGWRGGRGNWRGGNPSYFKNSGRGFQGYRGSLFKLCIIKITFLFLLTASALCRIQLLPVTHELVVTWMLTVKLVYKLSNVPDDLKWARNTHLTPFTLTFKA